jgi:hypothetical protein
MMGSSVGMAGFSAPDELETMGMIPVSAQG